MFLHYRSEAIDVASEKRMTLGGWVLGGKQTFIMEVTPL